MSRKIHAKMTFKLLHAEVDKFIQRVPIGLIVNRFSSDITILDVVLPIQYMQVVMNFAQFVGGLFLILQTKSYVLTAFYLTYVLLIMRLRARYSYTLKETTRNYFISKSPIVTTTVSAISGAPVLRTIKNESGDMMKKK